MKTNSYQAASIIAPAGSTVAGNYTPGRASIPNFVNLRGIPAGAVVDGEKAADVFEVGDHNSTFGGNPVDAATGLVVLETVNKPEFFAEITRKGEKIMSAIKGWNHPMIKEVRGRGLLIGIDIDKDAWPILEKAIARADEKNCGLLILSAGQKTLRLLPPLVISDSEIEQGLEILREIINNR